MAREKMGKVRDSAVHSSWLAPALGAGVGMLVGKALQSRAQSREDHRHEDYYGGERFRSSGYRGDYREYYGRTGYREDSPYQTYEEGTLPSEVGEVPGGQRAEGYDEQQSSSRFQDVKEQAGSRMQQMKDQAGSRVQEMKDRAGSKVEDLKGRAGEMKERVGAKAGELRHRMSEQAHSLRERLPDREQIRASTHEDTGLWALGAAALGLLFGFALPVTQKERQLLEPAKRKARELGEQAKDMAVQKGSQALDQASEKINAPSQQGEQGGPQPQGEAESPPALH
ncbi:MAG TPA: hypothetical protein VEB43_20425 [Anaeromyxobacter sp.]|nr:hypothetical protein [Anaeromyxobacter sp.]